MTNKEAMHAFNSSDSGVNRFDLKQLVTVIGCN